MLGRFHQDRSPGSDVEPARAAAAEREPLERDLTGRLMNAATTAARQWGDISLATDTVISVAESISARPKTSASQRAVLEQINWEMASPLVSRSTEAAGLRGRCLAESAAAADQRHQQALGEWSVLPRRRRWMTRKPEPERSRLPSWRELAAARDELVRVVRVAMAAELERVMPSPRPPSESARTWPVETKRRHDASSPSSSTLRSDGEVERPAERQHPVRVPPRDPSRPTPATSPPGHPPTRGRGQEPSF